MLSTLLYIIRKLTPKIGAEYIPPAKEDKKWKKVSTTTKRNGYEITNIPFILRTIYYLLSKFSMDLDEPVLNPIINAKYTVLEYGDRIPADIKVESSVDEFFLKSNGSYFLKESDKDYYKWMVDFSDLEEYDVHSQLYKYGCIAYFSENKLELLIMDSKEYLPTDEIAVLRFRATTAFKIIMEMHACGIHLCTAQVGAIKYLGISDYPKITDLIHLLTYDVISENTRVPILVDEGGLLNRIFGFTNESYNRLVFKLLDRKPFTREKLLGTEGTEWNKKIKKYILSVEDLFDKFGVDNFIKDELVDYFVTSSAMHNQFGDVSTYNLAVDGFLLPKVYKSNPGLLSRKDVDILNTLMVGISSRYPTLGERILEKSFSDESQKKIWNNWVSSLKEDTWFNPLLFEASVSF